MAIDELKLNLREKKYNFQVISNTRQCFIIFPNTEKRVENRTRRQRSIFDEIRSIWKCDETLSRMFDISSPLKLKLRSKRTNKIVKIYAI